MNKDVYYLHQQSNIAKLLKQHQGGIPLSVMMTEIQLHRLNHSLPIVKTDNL